MSTKDDKINNSSVKTDSKPPKKIYKDGLDQRTRERYDQKTKCIGFDPYEVGKDRLTADHDSLPAVTYIDILNYLVNTKSAYTFEELKAVKSLESYNQFVNGWVKDVLCMKVNNMVLVTGRVRHSQRMNDTPLKPWIIAFPDGRIDSAHCDCMAGLGEACSHVGALLFYIDHVYQVRAKLTVTQKKAYWSVPSYVDKVSYAEVRDIDFTSVDTKKKQVQCSVSGETFTQRSSLKLPSVPEPTAEEVSELNRKLSKTDTKPAILAVRSQFQDAYVPDILKDGMLPISLGSLKDEKFFSMEKDELLEKCVDVFNSIQVTAEQAKNGQTVTVDQAKAKEWHALRLGRITASNMKAVCSGSVDSPAVSTVQAICGTRKFSNKATQWGCNHENVALSAYTNIMKDEHVNVNIDKCGFFIYPEYPYIGASPDAVVTCDCCGEGVVEIKCPYCVRDKPLSNGEATVSFLENGKLKENHKYTYQVQTQILVTERDYCDFVVWTEKDITVERIYPNTDLHEEIQLKSKEYFLKVIPPELTGSLITREQFKRNSAAAIPSAKFTELNTNTVINDNPGTSDADNMHPIICACRKPYYETDNVIGCDNENCQYVWLHFSCVNIKRVPKGQYFCPDCKKNRHKRQRKQ